MSSTVQVDQSFADGVLDQVRYVLDAQFFHDILTVRFDGLYAHKE